MGIAEKQGLPCCCVDLAGQGHRQPSGAFQHGRRVVAQAASSDHKRRLWRSDGQLLIQLCARSTGAKLPFSTLRPCACVQPTRKTALGVESCVSLTWRLDRGVLQAYKERDLNRSMVSFCPEACTQPRRKRVAFASLPLWNPVLQYGWGHGQDHSMDGQAETKGCLLDAEERRRVMEGHDRQGLRMQDVDHGALRWVFGCDSRMLPS